MNVKINLQPKQGLFDYLMEHSESSWLGYGGSRGGAKSGAARRIMVRRRLQYPGTSGQILRRVWDDVQKNHVNKMWEEFPDLFKHYKATEHVIEFPNKSKLFFDAAENNIDVERKAFGPEFMDIMVDQAEQFTEAELKQLKTTCRWPNTPVNRCKFSLFFNPGGVSAGFLQRVFYTKEYHEREIPTDYTFVQAYGWDNVEWCRAALTADGLTPEDFYSWGNEKRFEYYVTRSQYGIEMNALPAHMRPGQLLGDFKKFAGQYFSNFNEDAHVWDLSEIIFQPHWPRWISIDWGYQHHTSVHWHTQAGSWEENGESKRLVVTYRELLKDHLSERALAEEIVSCNGNLADNPVENIYAGHDLWQEESDSRTKEQAMSEVFRRHGLPSLKQAVVNRVDGWRFMHRVLDEGEWLITRNCKYAIRAIPTAIFDEKKQNEDIKKTNTLEDDVLDELRYGLYSQYAPKDESAEVKIARAVRHIPDQTAKALYIMKMNARKDQELRGRGTVNNRSSGRYARYAARHGRVA